GGGRGLALHPGRPGCSHGDRGHDPAGALAAECGPAGSRPPAAGRLRARARALARGGGIVVGRAGVRQASSTAHGEDTMLAIWVKVRVKADQKERFLKAIEVDALGSEKDEAGCLRFNVLQDAKDANVYYFYEVYKDEAALEAHRAAPHYAVWRAAADT